MADSLNTDDADRVKPTTPPAHRAAVKGGASTRSSSLYRRLVRYLKPYRWIFLIGTLCSVIASTTDGAFGLLLKPLVDRGFSGTTDHDIWIYPAAIVGLFMVRGVFTFLNSYAMAYIGNRVLNTLRVEMFERLVALPTRYFDTHSSSSLVSRLVFEAQNVMQSTTGVITSVVRNGFTCLWLMGTLLYLNWRLTLFTITVLPAVTFIVRKLSLRMRELSRKNMYMTGELTRVVQETIDCQKVVKIYGGESDARSSFGGTVDRLRGNAMRISVTSSVTVPATQLLMALAVACMIYFALDLARAGTMTAGTFVSFVATTTFLLAPMKQLAEISGPFERGLAAAEGVFALIDEHVEDDHGTVDLGRARGAIRFVDVELRYVDEAVVRNDDEVVVDREVEEPKARRAALRGINLEIAAGETIALVGSSGGGKTSLANLIPRFYHATAGRILIDGVPIEEISLASLRAQIAMVSQDVVLFNETVASNIGYGAQRGRRGRDIPRLKGEALRAAVRGAAEAAHLAHVIDDMPEGFDTMIGENGVRLSGGQRQRLAIARAVLKDAPILILDEATSALDSESERHVQAALASLMQGRTTVVIAHRLSTIESADRIAVFDQGNIVEVGTHRALLAADGIYAKLYRIQYALDGARPVAPPVDAVVETSV
ncbi:MAG: lipid A export permease/ATP-binding protein MsbA [Burkholderiaceae bacterium]